MNILFIIKMYNSLVENFLKNQELIKNMIFKSEVINLPLFIQYKNAL